MIARGSDMSAPAPMPCTARKPASMIIEVDMDDRTAPRMKTTMPKM
ncbi:hypothetical protein JOE58_003283 [Curtobacterium luteum]|uniref:Transposase n=1 Tax=Curtobacterium luteum TaxID=33881 RepID=A0ABS2RYH4_9MICO|nr:hypothetical protein [Curtobacterium luteum]